MSVDTREYMATTVPVSNLSLSSITPPRFGFVQGVPYLNGTHHQGFLYCEERATHGEPFVSSKARKSRVLMKHHEGSGRIPFCK